MKISSLSLLLLAGSASAFLAPSLPSTATATAARTTQLQSRTDASDAIKAAQDASEKYGPTSPEAKVAWDTVEEMDASDNTVAFETPAYRMLSKEQVAEAAKQYKEQLKQLNLRKADNLDEKLAEMRQIATEMQSIQIEDAPKKAAQDSPELRAALAAAKEASEQHGATSSEARIAWETVEEIASSGLDNALGGMIEEECWVDMTETCLALEEVDRFINLVNTQNKGLNS